VVALDPHGGPILVEMADELKPAYLIAGSDRPKVDRAVARLRGRFEPDAVEHLDATEAMGEDAVAACNAMGLFGAGLRLVIVDNVEAWKAPEVKVVEAYLKSPAPGTTLALVGGELKKDAPVAKTVAGVGEVLIWDVQTKAIHRWIAEQFKLHRTKVEPEACRRLAELVGDDLYELAGEVEKLSTWAGGESEITEVEVDLLVAPRAESPPWNLTDAWGARDVAGVLRAAERMLDRTGDPVSRTLPRLVGSLTNHLRRARAAHRLESQGLSPADAASQLGMKPYPAQKLFGQVRNYSADELDAALIRLAQLDHALKGGSRLSGELELERALVEITAPAA
jgi:DNA polymerase-3 subunit delta